MGFELEEISGLTWYRPGRLACVQDEGGKLYIYDLDEEEVQQRFNFAGSGDYEGVEIIDYQAYVITNSGRIYTFRIGNENEVDSKIIKTPLNSNNNVEGLGFDPRQNRLLIACKGSPEIKKNKVKGKAVYGYRRNPPGFEKDPVLSITKKQLKVPLTESGQTAESIDFAPSGIAVHPLENRYYIVSFAGRLLVILDSNSGLEDVIKLDPKIFRQPEGICFSPDGTMYISSEGRGGDGYILEFDYHQ